MKPPAVATIRQLQAADAEAFSALRREVTAENAIPMGLTLEEELTRPIEGFRTQLSLPEPNAAFGAFIESELAGTAAVAWPSKFASSRHKVILWGTFVSPRFRGRGLGRQLVERAIAHARSNGVRRVNLTVYVPNVPAVALYEGLGFEQCGIEPEAVGLNGVFHDGQQMSLLLNVA
jgi:ribosomal protein S18 acetylase RimI-like enzyme